MGAPFDRDTVTSASARAGDPDWLREARLEAFARFESLPWPDQTLEEWKHTDIRGLDLGAFDALPAEHPAASGLDDVPDQIRALAIGQKGDRHGLAIQIDGDVVHLRLAPGLAEKGVVFGPASEVAATHGDHVRDTFGRAGASDHEAKFAALNHAFALGGVFLYVPRGVVVDKPIQSVRWISRGGIAIFPRIIIVADEGAEVTYIDHHASAALDAESLNVSAIEIYAHQNARVTYVAVQDFAQQVWRFSQLRAIVERDATVRALDASFGGKLSRSIAQAVMEGQGGHAELLGLAFGDHAQHIDSRTLQLHRGPNTSSQVYYKTALKGTARAVYSGLVDLEKEGLMADAQQANRNMLLSDGAIADASPFLEIKTSEVARATHAVSVGRPDAEVLFYMASRGIDPVEAEKLYVTSFFQEIIDRVRVPEIRETLEAAIEAELALED